jgi:hypothetical protein
LHLPRLLLWRRPYSEYDRPNEWRAPSWSPLCVDGPILFGLPWTPPSFEGRGEPVDIIRARRKQGDEITVPKFDFIDASVSLQSTEVPYGCVTHATLEVRGKLFRYQSESDRAWDPSTWGFSDFKVGRPAVKRWDESPPSISPEFQNVRDSTICNQRSQQSGTMDSNRKRKDPPSPTTRTLVPPSKKRSTAPEMAEQIRDATKLMSASSNLDPSGNLTIHAFLVCEIKNDNGQFFACILLKRLGCQEFRRIGIYFAKQSATREKIDDCLGLRGCPCWIDFQNAKEETITLV